MTRHWGLLVMLLVLAGLALYVYFVELPAEQKKTAAETAETQLLSLSDRDVTGLTVRASSGDVTLSRKDRTWRIVSPIQAEADGRVVEGLLRSLALGKVKRVVEEQASTLGPFGLEHPTMTLTLTADGRQETIAIGDSGPISSTLYVRRNDDNRVLLTDLAPKDFLNKSLLSFRKKEVVPIEQAQVDRVRLTYPKTEIVLYRTEGKDKAKWVIRYPIDALADQSEIRTLLIKLEDLKALGFIDPGPQYDEYSKRLTKPEIKITLHAGNTDHVVKFYQPDPVSGEAFAVTSPDAPIYRINPMTIKDLTKDLFALQDKRLLGVERDDIAMLEVRTRDEHYTLIRQNQTWVMEEEPTQHLDQEKVTLFVSRVVDLPAELRVVKQAGPLAPYGLTTPTAEFTATTKDGHAKGRLVLGTQTGGLVYAMGKGLPGIFQARSDLLTQIPTRRDLLARHEAT